MAVTQDTEKKMGGFVGKGFGNRKRVFRVTAVFSHLHFSPHHHHRKSIPKDMLLKAKQDGFSDRQIGQILGSNEPEARELRLDYGIKPWVKQVSLMPAPVPDSLTSG